MWIGTARGSATREAMLSPRRATGPLLRHCEEPLRRSHPFGLVRRTGLLRGACHRAARRADPVARNDGETPDCMSYFTDQVHSAAVYFARDSRRPSMSRCNVNCWLRLSACDSLGQPAARQGDGRLTMSGCWNIASDLPDESTCFRRIAQASDPWATVHGVVFDILVGRDPHAATISSGAFAPVMKATASDMV